MTTHSSASTTREETPHAHETSNTNIHIAVKRRAQSLIKNQGIDPQTRNLIRYAFEINDPSLAQLVCGLDAGKTIDMLDLSATPEIDRASEEKVETLTEMICQAGDESAAALLVLMATLENSMHPKALANIAKHLAFTHCGELNLNGMVDSEVVVLDSELLAENMLAA